MLLALHSYQSSLRKGQRVCQQLLQDRSREKVAVNDVDKFLTGLLQSVNVASQTMFLSSIFPPAALIEKTIATESTRLMPFL